MRISRGWETSQDDPLDVIERFVVANNWLFDRPSQQEIAVQVPGQWSDYNFFCSWHDGTDAMQFTLAFDVRVPEPRRQAVHELLSLINDKIWMGHFAIWKSEGLLVYRHVLPLRGCDGASREQVEDLVETAINECERFYPAFQYVIWGGKAPTEAMAAAVIEPVGEA
jgi:hypothetical protein